MVIETPALFLLALLLLTLPLNWLLAALTAAVVHELGHYLAILALGGRPGSFRLGVGGAVLEVEDLTNGAEALAALAGPAAGLVLTLLWPRFPRLALCALVQSLFNLIPICPLDGGRLLRCLFRRLFPRSWEVLHSRVEGAFLLLAALAVPLVLPGGLATILGEVLLLRSFLEKFLAMRRISRYNRGRYS